MEAAADEPMPRPPPEVDVAGCLGFSKEPAKCRLLSEDAEIQLWIGTSGIPLIEVDSRPAQAVLRPTIGDIGWTAAVLVPEGATSITVAEALGGDLVPGSEERWTLALHRIPPTPTVDRIEATLPDMNSKDRTPLLLRAIEELEEAFSGLEPHERFRALRLGTILALDAGRVEKGLELGHRALDEAIRRGELGDAVNIADILFHTHQDPVDRDWMLALLEVWLPIAGDGVAEVRFRYAHGFRAMKRLDISQALEDFRASLRRARRLGLENDELIAAGMLVGLATQLGDDETRVVTSNRVLEILAGHSRDDACTDAHVIRDLSWALLIRRIIGDELIDPRPMIQRAARYYAPGGGCDPGDNPLLLSVLHFHEMDIIRDALIRRDYEAARELLARFDRTGVSETLRYWAGYVEGALALAERDPRRALQQTNGLELAKTNTPILSWKAALLRSDAELRLDHLDAALQEALAAERVLDETSGQLAPDQGREVLGAAFRASAARAVTLQIDKGDLRGAITTARRARARQLRPVGSAAALAQLAPQARATYLEARAQYQTASEQLKAELTETWRMPDDARLRASRHHGELQQAMRTALKQMDAVLRDGVRKNVAFAEPGPGELTLLYHPLSEGWAAFAISSDGIELHRFALPDERTDESLANALLAPFDEQIGRAQHIRVLAVGELLSTRFHALHWRGQPLVFMKPVSYGLDLGRSTAPFSPPKSALVIADPATRLPGLGRLPQAAHEGETVAARLRDLGWEVQALSGDDAEHSRLVTELPRVGWLHYAGHGVAAGRSGWGSALPLAGEAGLEIADILSAPAVPPSIVLSACDTAGTGVALDGKIQIASAFLLAGADFVIAAQGQVADDAAPRFSRALYDGSIGTTDGPTLAQQAVLALERDGEPMSTWAGFYVWVR